MKSGATTIRKANKRLTLLAEYLPVAVVLCLGVSASFLVFYVTQDGAMGSIVLMLGVLSVVLLCLYLLNGVFRRLQIAHLVIELSEKNDALRDQADRRERVQQLMRASETRFRDLVENTNDILWETDEAGKYTYCSPNAVSITGYTPEELLGKLRSDFTPPEDMQRVRNQFARIRGERSAFSFVTYKVRFKDGLIGVFESSGRPVFDEDGRLTGYRGVDRDLTAHQLARDAIREAMERARVAFEHARIGTALQSMDGRYLKVNQAWCEMVGYSERELLTMTYRDVTHPDDADIPGSPSVLLNAGEIDSYEREKGYVHKNGHPVWALATISLVRDSQERPQYMVAQIQDVTERKKSESLLRESEERYRSITETSIDGIHSLNPSGQLVFANEAFADIFGYPREVIVGSHFSELVGSQIHQAQDNFQRLLTGETVRDEIIARHKDGHEFPVSFTGAPIRKDGEIVGITGACRDITDRKKAAEAQRRLAAVLEGTTDLVGFGGPDGSIRYMNRAGHTMLGIREDEDVSELNVSDFHSEWTNKILRDEARPAAIRNGVWNGEVTYIHRDGYEVPTLMVLISHKAPDGEVELFSAIARDITHRKEAEESLRARTRELESLTAIANTLAGQGGFREKATHDSLVKTPRPPWAMGG